MLGYVQFRYKRWNIGIDWAMYWRTTNLTAPYLYPGQHLLVVGMKIAYTVHYDFCFNNLAHSNRSLRCACDRDTVVQGW